MHARIVLKLTYSNLEFQNFLGEDPRTPSSRGGEGRGREGRRGRGNGREGGRGRIGKGGEGREGTGEGRREGGEEWGWWEGRGARHGLRPLETSSGSPPDSKPYPIYLMISLSMASDPDSRSRHFLTSNISKLLSKTNRKPYPVNRMAP